MTPCTESETPSAVPSFIHRDVVDRHASYFIKRGEVEASSDDDGAAREVFLLKAAHLLLTTMPRPTMSIRYTINTAAPYALLALLCSCAPGPVDTNDTGRPRNNCEGEGEEGEGEEGEGEGGGEGEGEEVFTESVLALVDGVPTNFPVIVNAARNALGFEFDARTVEGHRMEMRVERTPLTGGGPTDCNAVGLQYSDLSGELFTIFFAGANEGCGAGFSRLGEADGDRITGTFFGTLPPRDFNGPTVVVTEGTFDLRLDEGL